MIIFKKKWGVIWFLAAVWTLCGEAAMASGGGLPVVEKTSLLVFQLSIILFAAWVGRFCFNKLHLPGVLGEIMAGVAIGPYCLGQIGFAGFPRGLFPPGAFFPVSIELYSLATIASIILLFFVGLETDIEMFMRFSVVGSVVGVFGVIVSFVAGDVLGMLFVSQALGQPTGFFDPGPVFLGVISTATSVGITARILSGRKKMGSPEGTTILAAAVVDDVLGIIILAVVLGLSRSGQFAWKEVSLITFKEITVWLLFTFLGLRYGRAVSRLLKRMGDRNTIAVMAFGLALLLAGIFEKSGLAMIVGAYVTGLALSKTDLSYILQEKLEMMQQFFVPIFFCVMGMLVNLRDLASAKILSYGLLYVFFSIAGKMVGCSVPALFMNFNLRGALRVGVGMIPRGEVALIIAGIGLSTGIIGDEIFSIAMLMTFATTLLTPPLLDRMLKSDLPVLRKEREVRSENQSVHFVMPNPETAELLLNKVLAAFESEGFFVYRMDLPERLYQIRKNEIFIGLRYDSADMDLVFNCSAQDMAFVHTLFYEVIAELEYAMQNLQTLTDKKLIGKRIFTMSRAKNSNGSGRFRIPSSLALKVNLEGQTKEEVLEDLTDLMIRSGQLSQDRKAQVLKELKERERVMSTGMQDGIAIPHVKTSAVEQVCFSAGVSKQGIDFQSLDKKPATIFVLILASKEHPQEYLQSLAEICRFLAKPDNRERILACNTNMELFDAFAAQG